MQKFSCWRHVQLCKGQLQQQQHTRRMQSPGVRAACQLPGSCCRCKQRGCPAGCQQVCLFRGAQGVHWTPDTGNTCSSSSSRVVCCGGVASGVSAGRPPLSALRCCLWALQTVLLPVCDRADGIDAEAWLCAWSMALDCLLMMCHSWLARAAQVVLI